VYRCFFSRHTFTSERICAVCNTYPGLKDTWCIQDNIKKCHVYNIYPSSRLDMCCIQHMSLHTYATHINNTYDISCMQGLTIPHVLSIFPVCYICLYIRRKHVYVYRCFCSREFVLYSSESYSSICICISGILDTRTGYRKLLFGSRRILIIWASES